MADDQQKRLDEHLENIRVTALTDLRALTEAGGGMGVFWLAIPIIDGLAKASRTRSDHWREYVSYYMPRLALLADVMYKELRNPGAHALSASSRFRFTSGDRNRCVHSHSVVLPNGQEVTYLHASEFYEDVKRGVDRLCEKSRSDSELRVRMLKFFDREPPVGPAPIPDGLHGLTIASVTAASASKR